MRTGVLSDQAIKEHCPEFFPLDLGSSKLRHTHYMAKNPLKGIKVINKEHNDFARFPLNDLHNFAQFSVPFRAREAEVMAIIDYRQEICNKHEGESLENAYAKRVDDDFTPNLPTAEKETYADETNLHIFSNSSSLQKNSFKPNTAKDAFSQSIGEHASKLYHPQTRTLLGRISHSNEFMKHHNFFHPHGYVKGETIKPDHGEVLQGLNEMYRDDQESLQLIEDINNSIKD